MAAQTYVKVSGAWHQVSQIWVKVSGVWKQVISAYTKVSGVWQLTFASFVPHTDIYDTPGNYSPTIPIGSAQLVITLTGAGGSGAAQDGFSGRSGGSAGGTTSRTVALTSSDWGATVSMIVGAGGAAVHANAGTVVVGLNGGFSYANFIVSAGTFTMTGGSGLGGNSPAPAGGSASGGTTNIVGGLPSGRVGGNSFYAAGGSVSGANGLPGSLGSGGGAGQGLGGGCDSGAGGDGRIQLVWS